MDTLSHGLYGAAFFVPGKKEPWMVAGGLLGMMPDLVVQGAIIVQSGLDSGLKIMGGAGKDFPTNLMTLYYWTHSLFPVLVTGLLLFIFKRRYSPLILPYLLHILFDIFFHCGAFGTRIFYPFSNFHFCGVNYAGNQWFWEINYGVLVGLYFLLYIKFIKPFMKI